MKRFYTQVSVGQNEDGWRVLLDGRGLKTVGGRAQVLPTQALAEALVEEWADQGEEIDPALFILRDMADYAVDVIGQDRSDAIGSLVAYAGTDTLCYRAEPDEPLHERQQEVWEPLLHAAEQRWDVHFERIDGIMHRPQPAATLARMEAVLSAESDHVLAAVNTLTSLASSLVIALAALAPDADAETLWDVANLEEDWQASLWGKDYEAEERRAHRLAVFETAMRYARLARGENAPA